jgi:hypothetical protein
LKKLVSNHKAQNKGGRISATIVVFLLMSTSSVPAMAMFLLLDELWATSELKSVGAS